VFEERPADLRDRSLTFKFFATLDSTIVKRALLARCSKALFCLARKAALRMASSFLDVGFLTCQS
jgi:hypothetical protein